MKATKHKKKQKPLKTMKATKHKRNNINTIKHRLTATNVEEVVEQRTREGGAHVPTSGRHSLASEIHGG
jgi:hypothetical protein